jgi:hypothetical protein
MARTLEEIVARSEITDLLHRYTRGIDRGDWDLVRSCYHDDGFDDHGLVQGDPDEFVRYVSEFFADILSTTHHLGNILITVIGDRAAAESYAVAWHRLRTEGGGLADLIVGGRYVDELEKRDEEWRILRRRFAYDWTRMDPVNEQMQTTAAFIWGRRDSSDISYEVLTGPTPTVAGR